MNIQEKVQDLLKYCSLYQGHTYMMDERRRDETFQVLLPEEKMLREEMGQLRFVLLTGEAGDGKSRLLRNLSEELCKNGLHSVNGYDKSGNIFLLSSFLSSFLVDTFRHKKIATQL